MHRLTPLALAALFAGCAQAPETPTSPAAPAGSHLHASPVMHRGGGGVSRNVARDIARLRAVTARFHDFREAGKAGWTSPVPNCFNNPELGGMGYHFANPALFDSNVEALKPELLLYEPQKNGQMRFVAVEYAVPFAAWTASEPPQLYGQSFHRNEQFQLWVLHVWHFRNNPSGIFMDWNPKVSCRHAKE
jgi:hypothetical protein